MSGNKKRRLNAADLFGNISDDVYALCSDLLDVFDDRDAFAALIADANRKLTKHETGFVIGYLAGACGVEEPTP